MVKHQQFNLFMVDLSTWKENQNNCQKCSKFEAPNFIHCLKFFQTLINMKKAWYLAEAVHIASDLSCRANKNSCLKSQSWNEIFDKVLLLKFNPGVSILDYGLDHIMIYRLVVTNSFLFELY